MLYVIRKRNKKDKDQMPPKDELQIKEKAIPNQHTKNNRGLESIRFALSVMEAHLKILRIMVAEN